MNELEGYVSEDVLLSALGISVELLDELIEDESIPRHLVFQLGRIRRFDLQKIIALGKGENLGFSLSNEDARAVTYRLWQAEECLEQIRYIYLEGFADEEDEDILPTIERSGKRVLESASDLAALVNRANEMLARQSYKSAHSNIIGMVEIIGEIQEELAILGNRIEKMKRASELLSQVVKMVHLSDFISWSEGTSLTSSVDDMDKEDFQTYLDNIKTDTLLRKIIEFGREKLD